MSAGTLPWLELSVLVPLFAAPWLAVYRDPEAAARRCLIVTAATFFCAMAAWLQFYLGLPSEALAAWGVPYPVVLALMVAVLDLVPQPAVTQPAGAGPGRPVHALPAPDQRLAGCAVENVGQEKCRRHRTRDLGRGHGARRRQALQCRLGGDRSVAGCNQALVGVEQQEGRPGAEAGCAGKPAQNA